MAMGRTPDGCLRRPMREALKTHGRTSMGIPSPLSSLRNMLVKESRIGMLRMSRALATND